VKRFVLFHDKRHPVEMGENEIRSFLSHLARDEYVSSSTQNQALNALVFLYKNVLRKNLGNIGAVERAQRSYRLPDVFTHDEALAILGKMNGVPNLVASLLYSSGLRLLEALRLRVHDVDFGNRIIIVRRGKGDKDRRVPWPHSLVTQIQNQIEKVRILHKEDIQHGFGDVILPDALSSKFKSAARCRFTASRAFAE